MATKGKAHSRIKRRTVAALEAALAQAQSECDAALGREAAVAEILQIINRSPGDLLTVFDAMLERAMRLCKSDIGWLLTYEDGLFRFAGGRGLPEPFAEYLHRMDQPRTNEANAGLLTGAPFAQVIDMKDAVYDSGNPFRRAVVDLGDVRTGLAMSLRKDGRLLGSFNLARKEVRPFSTKQIALVENFAAQAVLAMENVRLITETREALEQQTATAEVLGVINSWPGDLAPVFEVIVEKAHSLCDASSGSLQLWDGQKFRGFAMRGFSTEMAERLKLGYGPADMPCQRIVEGERVVHCHDLVEFGSPTARQGAEIGGVRTVLYVALRNDDALLGQIVAVRKEVRPFSSKQIALVENFAAQAVIAMENARLLGELRHRTEEVAELNRGLEARVAEQVDELGRVGRLKRFLAPQLAELIVSQGDENILESHRREIVVVFCDLRGYTAFTETAEPEEVLDFLREYHGALGPLVAEYEGTLDQFSGDGIMAFFNDPVPVPDPAERAVRMAVAMREAAAKLIGGWRERGRELGFGAGIAQGYATLGQIGFAERSGYTAIGTVCNVAARLCAEAKDSQILLSQRVNVALKGSVVTEQVGSLTLKGLTQPVVAFNVPLPTSQPALRVIEGGSSEACL